jgi:ribosomal-protein-alanine N-acetyltransferase
VTALPLLQTARGVIRLAMSADAPKLLAYRLENREHLAPWEPLREVGYYTLAQCVRTIGEAEESARSDRGYPLLIFGADAGELFGTATLSNVVRGPFQACVLGYSIGARWQGRGLMHEALEAILAWAFGELGLHRVMANHLPQNERSARLLERLDFEREGYARAYLKIAGAWQDHVLTAKICAED